MDLYIVQMFQTDSMLLCNLNRIPCQMWKIRGMLIGSADTATCKDRIFCINFIRSLFILCLDSYTFIIFDDHICHLCIFIHFHIFKLLHLSKQLAGDFFSCHIFMKQDSRSGVRSLSCIGKFAVLLFKLYAILYQIIDDISGITDHDIYRFFPVLIMTGFHRVFKITVVVAFVS